MTPKQYAKLCTHANLTTQYSAAKFFGVNQSSVSRWASGTPIPGSVATLLRLMDALKLTAGDVERMLEGK